MSILFRDGASGAQSKPLVETLNFKESLLEAQSEASIDGILVVSVDGDILSFNHRFVEIWKIPARTLETRSDKTVLNAVLMLLASPSEFLARVEYLYQHPTEKSREEIRLNDGRILDRYSSPVLNAEGKPYGRVWFFRDVTDQKMLESQLVEAQRIALLGNWQWDMANDRTAWSAGLYDIYGIQPQELVATYEGYLSRVHPEDREHVRQQIAAVLENRRGSCYEHRIIRPDNSIRHHHVILRVETDNEDQPIRLFGTAQDVTERVELQTSLAKRVKELEAAILRREKAEKAMRDLALHDDLTGLYNNRGFYTLAEHHLKSSCRAGQHSLLIYADVDGLKRINDNFGHTEGSLAIATIADILRNSFRESDIIGRVGGDEFAILTQDSSVADMDNVTTRLQENLHKYNEQSNRSYDLALSFGGLSIAPTDNLSLDELIAKADKLMYDHKRSKEQASIPIHHLSTVEPQRVLGS